MQKVTLPRETVAQQIRKETVGYQRSGSYEKEVEQKPRIIIDY